ncbi:hypothetical protein ACFV1W_28275 [Kitasatospora sp. NPDC059648]|uniref:hypothetical protein n=1 Tax=Kitasatospora sp. NPDC059648 TaxID=3346894 RepID=UPI0036AF0B6D
MTNEQTGEPLGYGVVANVARETAHGEGGLEIRQGLKHFGPGVKLWIAPPRWHYRGNAVVVGRHRGNGRRYVTLVTGLRFLENFRARAVHSPALLRALSRPEPGFEQHGGLWALEEAEAYAEFHNTHRLKIRTDGPDRVPGLVSDPPPMELVLQDTTFHLAHFNAYVARYSSQPPPAEVPTP